MHSTSLPGQAHPGQAQRDGLHSLAVKRILGTCLGGFLLAAALGAESGSTNKPFVETVDVEVVNLEVYVTDGKGNAVTGLTREDFTLHESGELVEISNFYAVEGGRRQPGERLEGVAVPTLEESAPDPLFLTVYVDNIHISPFSRKRTLDQLRDFLKQRVRDGDRVMVASYTGGVRILQSFTNEWKPIAKALDSLENVASGVGLSREEAYKQVIAEIIQINDLVMSAGPRILNEENPLADAGSGTFSLGGQAPCSREMEVPARRYAAQRYNDIEMSVSGLETFVESMASLPGRKAVLHVSDGIPRIPAAEVYEFLHRFCSGAGAADGLSEVHDANFSGVESYQAQLAQIDAMEYDTSQLWEDLTDQANANGVTFFTLEAYGPRSNAGGEASTDPGRQVSWQQVNFVRVGNLQDTLNLLAAETGGRAIFNTVDFGDAFSKIGGDFDTFYSLGYAAPRTAEGKERKVEIDVKRSGLRVRHRKSLRVKPLEEKLADRTLGTLEFGLTDNPLAAELEIGKALPLDESLRMVPIRVRIPMRNLSFLPQGSGHQGRLSVYVAARDRRGWRAPVRTAEVPIQISAEDLEAATQGDYIYEVKMLMRDGAHSLAVGVRDDIGVVESYLLEEIVVMAR